jgi:hypothetical protein
MAAAGRPTNMTMEVEFTSGTWTDVSTFVDWVRGVQTKQGRSTEFDDVAPGQMTFVLQNVPDVTTGVAPFTPDSPVSPYYPNVTKGKRVRFTVYRGATAYQRFIGWTQAWTVDLSESVMSSTLTVTATDRLGIQNSLPLNAMWVEYWKNASNASSLAWDVWPLDEQANASSYRNISQTGSNAIVNAPRTGTGSVTLEQNPKGIFADGSLKFTRDNTEALRGPCVSCVPQGWVGSSHKQWMFWFRTTTTDQYVHAVYTTTTPTLSKAPVGRLFLDVNGALQWDNAPSTNITPVIATGTSGFLLSNPAGQQYWITAPTTNVVVGMTIRGPGLPAGCVVSSVDTVNGVIYFTPQMVGTTLTSIVNGVFTLELPSSRYTPVNGTVRYDDGQWHSVYITDYNSTNLAIIVDGNATQTITGCTTLLSTGSWTHPTLGSFSVGGQYKNVFGFQGDISGIAASTGSAYVNGGGFEKWGFPIGNPNFSGSNQAQDTLKWLIRSDLGATAVSGTNYVVSGADNRLVSNALTTGNTLGDALSKLHRTVGGQYWVNPATGLPTAIMNDSARPATSLFTVQLGVDDDISNGQQWAQNVQGKPTRVTVNSPAVTVNAVDTTAETNGVPVNQINVDTWSIDQNNAFDVAWSRLKTSSTLRLAQFSVDLITAEHDFYASLCASSFPGMRVTVTTIPSGFVGVTQTDAYVQGWTETWTATKCVWTFDTTPADAPGEAIYDTTRFSWGDGVCTVSACTATATTLTLTWTGTTQLSTTAGDYPLDVNVNGERVTITSAPSGGTSPQTVTVTRGITPTVARAHLAGEPVDVWNGYSYAF